MNPEQLQLLSFRNALPHYLSRLANLHTTTMETLLSELGEGIVRRFYLNASKDPKVIGLCALKNGNLVGWAMGCADPSGLFKKLAHQPIWFLAQLAKVSITRPNAIAHLIGTLFQPGDDELGPNDCELTYIGVDPKYTRQGIGFSLLVSYCNEARSRGFQRVLLSVEHANSAAIALYKSFGFTILREYQEGHFSRYRMCLLLDKNFLLHNNETN